MSVWRSDRLAAAVATIEDQLDAAWAAFLAEYAVTPGTPDELRLAELAADDPAGHDWRLIDAALARLTCPECGFPTARGPLTCLACELRHGSRFGARETDRPGVPAGNEHAIRVASAVARHRERYSPRARAGYELLLPDLLAGALPTTAQAQAAKALINKLTPAECDTVTSLDEVIHHAARR